MRVISRNRQAQETLNNISSVCLGSLLGCSLNALHARIVNAVFKPIIENAGEAEMSVYVGVDVHKRFCQAALMNEMAAHHTNRDSIILWQAPQGRHVYSLTPFQ